MLHKSYRGYISGDSQFDFDMKSMYVRNPITKPNDQSNPTVALTHFIQIQP